MRLLISGLAIAGLLVSGVSFAGPDKNSGTKSTPSEAGGTAPSGGEAPQTERATDTTTSTDTNKKSWEIGAAWENHTMIVQSGDLAGGSPSTSGGNDPAAGVGNNKEFNYFSLYLRWEPTQYDRFTLRGGMYERFLADSGESGLRLDDTAIGYVRRIPLPAEFTVRVGASVYFPTSYASQLQSLRFAPRLSVELEKKFGKYVSADIRMVGDYYNCQYAEAGSSDNDPTSVTSQTPGGDANAEWRVAAVLEGEVTMPFLDSLAIGASLYDGYIGYYQVGAPPVTMNFVGAESDQQFTNQPVQQEYGGEVFIRYTMPTLAHIKSDLTLALAPDGDPSLGYTSLLHDGIQHTYPGWRQNAEVYGVLSARY
jgi:hypothetical protein